MKVIVAMDSMKGSLSSLLAGRAAKEGILEAVPEAEVRVLPVADGGEGTVEALTGGLKGNIRRRTVCGPLGQPVEASYGVLPDQTAVIEMASAAGLPLLTKEQQNPMLTTTYGVGELILDALDEGCRSFIVGIGGSATNDGGIGMLQALGVSFQKADGSPLAGGAQEIAELAVIDRSAQDVRLAECDFQIACDVRNPLCGSDGASRVFGPQKGADPEMAKRLDAALSHYAKVTMAALEKDCAEMPGAGAAGGLGYAFATYLNGTLRPGVDIVLDAVLPDRLLQWADVVVTGEGRFDGQTAMGKAPVGIAARAKQKGCRVLVFAGGVEYAGVQRVQRELGLIDGVFGILPEAMSLDDAMQEDAAYQNMRFTAEQVFRVMKV